MSIDMWDHFRYMSSPPTEKIAPKVNRRQLQLESRTRSDQTRFSVRKVDKVYLTDVVADLKQTLRYCLPR